MSSGIQMVSSLKSEFKPGFKPLVIIHKKSDVERTFETVMIQYFLKQSENTAFKSNFSNQAGLHDYQELLDRTIVKEISEKNNPENYLSEGLQDAMRRSSCQAMQCTKQYMSREASEQQSLRLKGDEY